MIKTKSRDNARTPVQWNDSEHGGFTKGTPWLGVNDNHKRINMAAQMADPSSVRSHYKRMIALRADNDVLKYGSFSLVAAKKHLFIYDREWNGSAYRVLLNFGKRPRKALCSGRVVISNYERITYDGVLRPWEAVVIEKGEMS
jgi:glycosidase